jgi:hypothetical protein
MDVMTSENITATPANGVRGSIKMNEIITLPLAHKAEIVDRSEIRSGQMIQPRELPNDWDERQRKEGLESPEKKCARFWNGFSQLIEAIEYRPYSYANALEKSVGSIVQLPHKGDLIVCFNTTFHQIVDESKVDVRALLGVTTLKPKEVEMLTRFFSRPQGYCPREGYKQLWVFHCEQDRRAWSIVDVPKGIDLGDYNKEPDPDFQYFKSSQLLSSCKWEV